MNKIAEDTLLVISLPYPVGVIGSQLIMADIFTLYTQNIHVFTIKADGTVEINPKFTAGQAVDEFYDWMIKHTNVVQVAIAQAKDEMRADIVKQIENQGKQWGIGRSMKLTNYSNAAQNLADLIRK